MTNENIRVDCRLYKSLQSFLTKLKNICNITGLSMLSNFLEKT